MNPWGIETLFVYAAMMLSNLVLAVVALVRERRRK